MITPPTGDPVPERCLACQRGRCAKCWRSWADYTTGDSWFCDCPHQTVDTEPPSSQPS